jgi:hypothetical protein
MDVDWVVFSDLLLIVESGKPCRQGLPWHMCPVQPALAAAGNIKGQRMALSLFNPGVKPSRQMPLAESAEQ